MNSSFFLPSEIRNLPLNVKMCALIDHCKDQYHDAIINPIRDRWQADSKYFSPEAIIKELGGEEYMKVIGGENYYIMSRVINSIFSMKGGRDSLSLALAFLGIHGKIVDYFTYTRSQNFPDLLDPDIRQSMPVMNPCEVYVVLQIDDNDVTDSAIEYEMFRKLVEIFLWSCANLVAILIIRKVMDLTLPVIKDLTLDTTIGQEYGDSLVFNIPHYNDGRYYGGGTKYYAEFEEKNLVTAWPPFGAPWNPVQSSSSHGDDETYGRYWIASGDLIKVKQVTGRFPGTINIGDYVTLRIPVFIDKGSNADKVEVKVSGAGLNLTQVVPLNRGQWYLVHIYGYATAASDYLDLSLSVTCYKNNLEGEVRFGPPRLWEDARTIHVLGEIPGNIGMYDMLELIEGGS